MPAEGAVPTVKCKNSCDGEIKNIYIYLIQTSISQNSLICFTGSAAFIIVAAGEDVTEERKRHTCDCLGLFPRHRVSVVMSRTPASRTLSSSHTDRKPAEDITSAL